MLTIRHGLGGHEARRTTKAMRLAALLGVLVVTSVAVNALIILA
jgi:hypothetical protein